MTTESAIAREIPSEERSSSVCPAQAKQSVTLLVCTSCRGPGEPADADLSRRPGAALAEETAGIDAPDVCVRAVNCLGNCNRGLSIALMKPGSWSYVFGGLAPGDGAELLAAARLFAGSENDLLPYRGRPDCLKGGLIARIPPLDNLEKLP